MFRRKGTNKLIQRQTHLVNRDIRIDTFDTLKFLSKEIFTILAFLNLVFQEE